MALPAADFTHSVAMNGTDYRLLEETKACVYSPKTDPDTGTAESVHTFDLRRGSVVEFAYQSPHQRALLGR
jgi:hypothetical protein